MALKRMRMAAGVLEELKKEDPDTALTLNYIQTLIRTEAVPVLAVGKKKLVAVEDVLRYLEDPYPALTRRDEGTIRPVPKSAG